MDYTSDNPMPIRERVASYLRSRPGQWCSSTEIASTICYSAGYVNKAARDLLAQRDLLVDFETRLVPVVPHDPGIAVRREFRAVERTT